MNEEEWINQQLNPDSQVMSANEAYWRKKAASQGVLRAPPPRSAWRRFMENIEEGMRRGPAGLIAPYAAALVETGDGKSYSERRKAFTKKEKERRESFDIADAPDSVGDYTTDIAGNIVGSLISDPTNLITGPAKTIVGKAITAGAVGAGADAALQGAEIASGLRDEYSPMQTGINAAAGPVFVGGAHAVGKGVGRYKESKSLKEAAVLGRQFGRVTSLTRTPEHNKRVGGVPNSYHVKGRAMDIARAKGVSHADIVAEFKRKGYNLVEALDEGDHTHLAFDFKTPAKPYESGIAGLKRLAEEGRQGTARSQAIGAAQDQDADFSPLISGRLYADNSPEIDALLAEGLELRNAMSEIGVELRDGKISPEEADARSQQIIEAMDDRAKRMQLYRLKEGLPVNEPELLGDNVAVFPGQKRPPQTPQDIDPQTGQPWGTPIYDDVLTPAERQDMDASVPAPPAVRGAMSEDIIDSVVGQGKVATTPVNDVVGAAAPEEASVLDTIVKTLKEIKDDESGSYRPSYDSGGPRGPDEPANPTVSKLQEALKTAKKAGPEQKKKYRDERKKRVAELLRRRQYTKGVEGLKAEKAALGGELPKVDLEAVRGQFTQDEIDELIDGLRHSRLLSPLEGTSAADALDSLMDGKLPTPGELALLYRVYPELVDTLLAKRPLSQKLKEAFWRAYETSRSSMGSGDASFSGRQGFMMISRPEYWKATAEQFKAMNPAGGDAVIKDQIERIVNSPHYGRAKTAGLKLMDLSNVEGGREEFAVKSFAEDIPGLKHVVKASNRAYTYMGNELRFDVFAGLVDKFDKMGLDIDDEKLLKGLGEYINTFTGRGSLGKFDRAMPFLNAILFAPRFVVSTFQRLNPLMWARLPAPVRKEALRDASAYVGAVSGLLGLAAWAGYEVDLDPRKPTGLRIKHGDTTYDVGAGMTQTVSLLAKILTNSKITGKGEEEDMRNAKFGKDSSWDILSRFVRTKLHPTLSYMVDAHTGKNVVGEEFNVIKDSLESFMPMYSTSMAEHVQEVGPEGLFAMLPVFFGIGVNTFKPKEGKAETDPEDAWIEKQLNGSTSSSSEDKWLKEQGL